ncbi:MAG: hypothetical protein SPL63_00885 [Roseburia faecis]|nr:hypothetical protein [Roseburia faecis]
MKILKRYVGNCPRCHSPLTGKLAPGPDGKADFSFGSPIIYCRDLSGYNCACPVCGDRWYGIPTYQMTDIKRIKALKKLWDEEVGKYSPLTQEEENEILNNLSIQAGLTSDGVKQKRKRSWFSKYVVDSFANDARTIMGPLTEVGISPGSHHRKTEKVKEEDQASENSYEED